MKLIMEGPLSFVAVLTPFSTLLLWGSPVGHAPLFGGEALCSGRAGFAPLRGSCLVLIISPCCRILQYGQMSVIVERQTVHETKGDGVAKGEQGLLNLDPRNVVFYVGGYPSSFTVRQVAGREARLSRRYQRYLWSFLGEKPLDFMGKPGSNLL